MKTITSLFIGSMLLPSMAFIGCGTDRGFIHVDGLKTTPVTCAGQAATVTFSDVDNPGASEGDVVYRLYCSEDPKFSKDSATIKKAADPEGTPLIGLKASTYYCAVAAKFVEDGKEGPLSEKRVAVVIADDLPECLEPDESIQPDESVSGCLPAAVLGSNAVGYYGPVAFGGTSAYCDPGVPEDVTAPVVTKAAVRYTSDDGVWIDVTFNEPIAKDSVPTTMKIRSYIFPDEMQDWNIKKAEMSDDLLMVKLQVAFETDGFWFAISFGEEFAIELDGIEDLAGNASSVTTFAVLEKVTS